MVKTLDDYKKEGWKVTTAFIIGFEEAYNEKNEQITYILYSDGTKEIKHRGWSRYGYREPTDRIPYNGSPKHGNPNKGKRG